MGGNSQLILECPFGMMGFSCLHCRQNKNCSFWFSIVNCQLGGSSWKLVLNKYFEDIKTFPDLFEMAEISPVASSLPVLLLASRVWWLPLWLAAFRWFCLASSLVPKDSDFYRHVRHVNTTRAKAFFLTDQRLYI